MTTYRREDDIAQVRGADRVTLLLLTEPDRPPVALTGSGVTVWDELGQEPREVGEIVANVARRFQVSESLIESDIHRLCEQLSQAGFLLPQDDAEGSRAR